MQKTVWLLLSWILAGVCVAADLAEDGNLLVNGNFTADIQGWQGDKTAARDGKLATTPAPEFVSFVADDGVGEAKGCLNVSIRNVDSNCTLWTSGAYMKFKKSLAAGTKIRISFDAKSLKGSRRVVFSRPCGGGGTDTVLISAEWQPYELFFTPRFDTPGLYFGIVDHYSPKGYLERGELLLDNVSVTLSRVMGSP